MHVTIVSYYIFEIQTIYKMSLLKITQQISPASFLRMAKTPSLRSSIVSVKFIPPILGSKGFGSFKVEFKNGFQQSSKQKSTAGSRY